MFPDPIRKAMEAVGVSEASLDRVRLAQGVVGKASYVAAAALLVLVTVGAVLREPVYLIAVAFLAVALFLIYFIGSLWFSHNHPDLALLEGAELIRWRQIDIAAKGMPLPPAEENKAIGSDK